jgi:hypothetical protein
MFAGEADFRYSFLGLPPGLTHTHLTRLEKVARDKHTSLLGTFINYSSKKVSVMSVPNKPEYSSLATLSKLV